MVNTDVTGEVVVSWQEVVVLACVGGLYYYCDTHRDPAGRSVCDFSPDPNKPPPPPDPNVCNVEGVCENGHGAK